MKKISEKECEQIINTFYELNAPVKIYGAVKELLTNLPEIKEKNESVQNSPKSK
jgi:hypothetical protein